MLVNTANIYNLCFLKNVYVCGDEAIWQHEPHLHAHHVAMVQDLGLM